MCSSDLMLFTEDFTPETRVLMRRGITDRVRAIAPFLRFDSNPYLVVTDLGDRSQHWGTGSDQGSRLSSRVGLGNFSDRDPNLTPANFSAQSGQNSLYWIIDAYTVSSRYPYSDPGDRDFNYIRNSVKVVVDAYKIGRAHV